MREGDSHTLCPFERGCDSPPEVIALGAVQAARRRPRDAGFSFQGRRYVITGMFWPGWLDARMAEVRDAVEPLPKPDRPWEDLLIPR